ncbi:MAG TPA: hypothetical protein VKQ08_07080, partial [Cyclobacteriaceae bacterium]|nr:hypothetical protein [Cyclobacteriaceae bacterium]
MKKLLVYLLCLSAFLGEAQIKPTTSFTISGDVVSSLTVTVSDLKKWNEVAVGDLVITNHLGEKKSEAK